MRFLESMERILTCPRGGKPASAWLLLSGGPYAALLPGCVKRAPDDRQSAPAVKAQISEADVPRVKPGMPVYFNPMGEPDRRYEVKLLAAEPAPATRP